MSQENLSIAQRVLRYDELVPCTTAFIDARTPGSDKKQNYCLIGQGVAENPGQVVHIKYPHPFDIGAAKQPNGCKNSHHSHDTAEVFVVHKGSWKFTWGEHGTDGEAVLEEGDTISIPTNVFRGFENVGNDEGFLFCILGLNKDGSAGQVHWAPYVYEQATKHGLVLLDDGRLLDTLAGDVVPEDAVLCTPTTAADVPNFDSMTVEQMLRCVITNDQLAEQPVGGLNGNGVKEIAVVGAASTDEALPAAKMAWTHGFSSRRLQLEPNASTAAHTRAEEEVLFVHNGCLSVTVDGEEWVLNEGDLITIPVGSTRSFRNSADVLCDVIVARGADVPQAASFS
ncbi:cupin domain-containing protein [uncultured Umboniibacter sp.]|uniref:cupin domain-containing protein n=1 Tax=uncultured Umboniibacter sp. TaxID=1798917 RepID=UPI00262346C3|nr:cupin domain-containing protein [uncultured Umboniibacter sp.]